MPGIGNSQSPICVELSIFINHDCDGPCTSKCGNPFICRGFGAVRYSYTLDVGVFICDRAEFKEGLFCNYFNQPSHKEGLNRVPYRRLQYFAGNKPPQVFCPEVEVVILTRWALSLLLLARQQYLLEAEQA